MEKTKQSDKKSNRKRAYKNLNNIRSSQLPKTIFDKITANSFVIYDLQENQLLLQKNEHKKC